MVKKKSPEAVPRKLARQAIAKDDAAANRQAEADSKATSTEPEDIIASLISEYDTLDSALILAILSEIDPTDLAIQLPDIRHQLAMLLPEPEDLLGGGGLDVPTDPSLSTSVSDTTDLLDRASISVRDYADDIPEPTVSPPPPSSWKEIARKQRKGKGKASGSASGSGSGSGSSGSSQPSMISASNSSMGNGGRGTGGLRVATGSPSATGTGSRSESGSSKSLGGSTSPTEITEDDIGLEDEMGLLQSLFPNLSTTIIRTALDEAVSIEAAINQLLSVEMIKDVQEKGVWPDDEHLTDEEEFKEVRLKRTTSGRSFDNSASIPMSRSGSAGSQTSVKSRASTSDKKHAKPRHYALIDTLQRIPTPSSHSSSRAQSPAPLTRTYGLSGPAPNAWHILASLANQLAQLLPSQTESYFMTFLHSPEYRSSYYAVHAALARIPDVPTPSESASEAVLQDIYGLSLTEEPDPRRQKDVKVAMRVGGGDVDVVMDLVELLDEISQWPQDEDVFDRYGGSEDEYEMPADSFQSLPTPSAPSGPRRGFTSSQPAELPQRFRKPKRVATEPEGPKFIPGAQPAASSAAFPTAYDDFGSPSAFPSSPRIRSRPARQVHLKNWQRVDRPVAREVPGSGMASAPTWIHPSSSSFADMTAEDCMANADLAHHKREQAIRDAGRHFAGGSHMAGGKAINATVASHYASQARKAGDSARVWEAKAAVLRTGAQLATTGNEIDLHHMTVAQAQTAASNAVNTFFGQSRRSGLALRIITGVGNHSVGKIGKLGPAVAGALEKEGWRVDRGESRSGYLMVRGRK